MGAASDKHKATPGPTPEPKDMVGYEHALKAKFGSANGEEGAGDFSDEEASHEAGPRMPENTE